MLSAILINWLALSSNTLMEERGNSGVLVIGFNVTFFCISLIIAFKDSSLNLVPFCFAYLPNTSFTCLMASSVGL